MKRFANQKFVKYNNKLIFSTLQDEIPNFRYKSLITILDSR
jgi:anthranilate/para-aminobenzoate synthase component II